MAYCIAKSIEIQRSKALKEIFLEDISVAQVARRFGRFRLESLKWHILTRSSAPRIHPNALDEKLGAYVISSPFFLISFKILVFPFEFNIFFAISMYFPGEILPKDYATIEIIRGL